MTRLGDFSKFIVPNFLVKVSQMFDDFWDTLKKFLLCKGFCGYIFGYFGGNFGYFEVTLIESVLFLLCVTHIIGR